MPRLSGEVVKGWGSETIFVTNDLYCGKLLNFKKGGQFSMHFHKDKDETWYVLEGEFEVKTINTEDASIQYHTLGVGDVWRNPPMLPHQVYCLKEGTLLEVSTPDSVEDNYRIFPGDSQK